jgi:DNA-binding transcriptional LysR family regulator
VRSGLADFGIGDITNASAIPSGIEADPLTESGFHVVLQRHHPLAAKSVLGMTDLREEAIIAMPFGAGMRRTIDGAAADAGVAFDRTITVSQFATIFRLVQAGVGISIVPALALTSATYEGVVSRPLTEPRLSVTLGLLRLHSRPASPAAEGFVELLRARLGAAP